MGAKAPNVNERGVNPIHQDSPDDRRKARRGDATATEPRPLAAAEGAHLAIFLGIGSRACCRMPSPALLAMQVVGELVTNQKTLSAGGTSRGRRAQIACR
jgi:hypothetical protein